MIAARLGAPFDYARLAASLGVPARAEAPLAEQTTMKVGGPAAWLFQPRTIDQAAKLFAALAEGPLPIRLLGAGSNVVVSDAGLRAAVIQTELLFEQPLQQDQSRVRVSAGQPVPGLARWAAKQGLAGLEFAEGIPAQLGGAIRMNAGANGSWFASIVEAVIVAAPSGIVREHRVGADDFAYRDSFVARQRLFVLGATLRLVPDDEAAIRARLSEFKERRKRTQPLQERSAGCAFANWPDQPIGQLVEKLGLKGLRIGDAEVSPLHGNFIVNRGRASAADVIALIDKVRSELAAATGREPRIEIEIWSDER